MKKTCTAKQHLCGQKNETFHLAYITYDSDLRRQGYVTTESIMKKSRKFYKDIINHCYQRTADNGVLFYTVSDHLVYFTLYCVLAKKYDAVRHFLFEQQKKLFADHFRYHYPFGLIGKIIAGKIVRRRFLKCLLAARQNTMTRTPGQ